MEHATLRVQEEPTVAGLDHSAARTTCLTNWGPTFDMSPHFDAKRKPHTDREPGSVARCVVKFGSVADRRYSAPGRVPGCLHMRLALVTFSRTFW